MQEDPYAMLFVLLVSGRKVPATLLSRSKAPGSLWSTFFPREAEHFMPFS